MGRARSRSEGTALKAVDAPERCVWGPCEVEIGGERHLVAVVREAGYGKEDPRGYAPMLYARDAWCAVKGMLVGDAILTSWALAMAKDVATLRRQAHAQAQPQTTSPTRSAGGRPSMSLLRQKRLRAALRVLRRRRGSWELVARATGLSLRTVMRIAGGGGGGSTETAGRVAAALLPGPYDVGDARDLARAARALLGTTTTQIEALGAAAEGQGS